MAWVLLGCSLAGFLGRLWWVLDLASHFCVQYLVVAGVLGLLALVLRWWALLLPVSFCLFVNLYLIYPFYFGGPTAESPSTSFRVMTINVNAGNRQREAVLDTITGCHCDVLFVLEYNEFWQEALAPLESTYPYTRQVCQDDNFGMAVYSRLPFAQAEMFPLAQPGFWVIEVQLCVGEQMWTVMGIHVMPPVSGRASQTRNEQLVELAERVAGISGPCVVVGDLNCTPWSCHFRQLLQQSPLRDSSCGFGVQATWPTQVPAMMIPIDHCLVSGGGQVVRRFVTGQCGSDHRGLVIDFTAPGRTAGK